MDDDALAAAVVLKWCLHGSWARSRSLDGDSVLSYTILLVLLFTVPLLHEVTTLTVIPELKKLR